MVLDRIIEREPTGFVRRQAGDHLREARASSLPAAGHTPTPRLIEADRAIPAPVVAWAEEFARKMGITHGITVRLMTDMKREGILAAHSGGADSFDGRSLIGIDRARMTENDAVTYQGRTVTVNGLLESLSHELAHAAHPSWSEAQIRAGVAEYWVLQER